MTFPNSRDLNKSVQKQSCELFLAMTTKQRAIKRMSFELLVRSGRSANKTEALSKTHNNICTLVLRNARTNPCFSIFVPRRRNWDFGATHLCHAWHEPCPRQAGAPLMYASILVPLLRSQVRYKSCFYIFVPRRRSGILVLRTCAICGTNPAKNKSLLLFVCFLANNLNLLMNINKHKQL